MVKGKRVSHGLRCVGVHRSRQKCTLARNGFGGAVILKRVCDDCEEQRCKAHCRCAREGTAEGRRASRNTRALSTRRAATTTSTLEDKFDDWRMNCEYLVCDHERCLRTDDALLALRTANLQLVDFPKCSQDFNAIENAWKILRERLDQTHPVALESRDDFIKRLHATVRWANQHRKDQLWKYCVNQKERADDCLAQKLRGGRTQW